jgi:hypothetical protein
MGIGKKVAASAMHGLAKDQGHLQKDADLLCGDAIINFKTI